jgi:hypothetical protein
MTTTSTSRIAELNDQFRKTFQGGQVFMTRGIQALGPEAIRRLVDQVQRFDRFNEDNDPHGEHDFGVLEEGGEKVFWKIDYYDPTLTYGSADPADPTKTTRVLTILLASEY